MMVLGIETSCDDTGVAIYDDELGLLFNKVESQHELHSRYGGVLPELASRAHSIKLPKLIKLAISQKNLLTNNKVDAIAYTAGPGLVGSLLVGSIFGKSLAFSLKIPVIPVHHIEGHIFSVMLCQKEIPDFPFLALLISGGNTQIISVQSIGKYRLLGRSRDDSVGEVFDKVARHLGLKYPGGYLISSIANKGNPGKFRFPRPMIHSDDLDLSFSGLKTSVLNVIQERKLDFQTICDIAYEFEKSVVDTLIEKCRAALNREKVDNLVVVGGVGSNFSIRSKIKSFFENIGKKVFFPKYEFCTDNGAMIAYAGTLRLKYQISSSPTFLKKVIDPKLSISKYSEEI
ncbi:tRNA (adenosine(37)-N6)-threonylcarbamoyltransferase complex transferase subunit TsaD [Candidatus Riesia pediculicola]|uniref:tRNA (adenosine(37)-N6)-threonylcarbamoyltransferase complex transferase subunit TsaD n=1 Tax=Candidatus Riesia pediculicola TaxID=401619 RepID=UPI0009C36661|nr:tRNA (adenosine(37)-N6)-threonylcarbamoyltransferase complex transferase subunit TsaD [Candidatus Riesia pediculicola]ARC54442.1 tRNA threonylcarbamoyl adenosine modification protein TsaD [Candidatus Riesia pediculicola]